MKNSACFSHKSDNWKTPSFLYDYFVNFLKYRDCFPYLSDYDEFKKTYNNDLLFVNPPFSQLASVPSWIKKQLENGCRIVLLLPSRTDTIYFHELLELTPMLYFIKGRLHFNDSKANAPFPTMLMAFGYKNVMPLYYGCLLNDKFRKS